LRGLCMEKCVEVKNVRNILLSDKIAARPSSSEADQVVDWFLENNLENKLKAELNDVFEEYI
jgi:hypothetical protein